MPITIHAAPCASECAVDEIVEFADLSVKLLVEAIALPLASLKEIVSRTGYGSLAGNRSVRSVLLRNNVDQTANSAVAVERCRTLHNFNVVDGCDVDGANIAVGRT